MKVSILTAAYNSSETLDDCFQSIHSQTYPLIEHIIIDGGSTDGKVGIIKRYKGKIALPILALSTFWVIMLSFYPFLLKAVLGKIQTDLGGMEF